jgi:hypothetical protein
MTATAEELLARLNALRRGSGRPQLKGWRHGRKKLEEAVAAEERARAEVGGSARRRRVVEALRAKTVENGCTPGEAEAARAKAKELAAAGRPARGAIGAMCAALLRTGLPYGEIAARVRARYPDARTTARSLASVASDLRAAGVPVAARRAGPS